MKYITSTISKKITMAITGQLMVLFVFLHLLGNSTVYFSWLNAYAEHLHVFPPMVWSFRYVMTTLLLFHIYLGIQLTLQNRAAKPAGYAVKKNIRTTFASKTMIWTGLIIGAFLLYHLLHFTLQITNPEISAKAHLDALGRPDVMNMVVSSFQIIPITLAYIVSLTALMLHLRHGIQSSFQTLGLNHDKTISAVSVAGNAVSVVLFIFYVTIPVMIFLGIVKG